MKLQYEKIEAWPPLAWLAVCEQACVRVCHGPQVEVHENWFCEAVWAGEFSTGDLDETDLIAGSGGRLRGTRVVLVSSGTTVDRLQSLETANGVLVSNLLACLVEYADAEVDPTYRRGTIRRPIFIEKEDIAADELITAQYKQLRSQVYLGVQYEFLARLAKYLSIDAFELGVCVGDVMGMIVRQHVEPIQGPLTRTYVLRPNAPQELQFLRYFEFPIINVSKGEMERIAKERGFYPILEMSWFCFEPLKGRPCGLCNPCKHAIEGGMARRIGWRGLIRYYAKKMMIPIADFIPRQAKDLIKRLGGVAPMS